MAPSLRQPGALHGGPQILADLPGGAFGRLQRDIAGKALDDHDVDDALADLVALDEAAIFERQVGALQPGVRLTHFLDALDLLDADIEQADGRPLDVEQRSCHGRAHEREIAELAGAGADVGADVEHDAFGFDGRPQGRDGRDARCRPWGAGSASTWP